MAVFMAAQSIAADNSASKKYDSRARMTLGSASRFQRESAFVTLDSPADTAGLRALGAEVRRMAGNIAIVSASRETFDSIAGLGNVRRISLSSPLHLTNNLSRRDIHADEVTEAPGIDGLTYTGRGVIAGLFDTGFDFGHPSVRRDGRSRVKAMWHYPSNDGSCIEYAPEDLDRMVTEDAEETHGCHVLGTMAGYIEGNPYNGVARDAELIVGAGELYNVNIADGVSRMAAYARSQGKPCVINLSISDYVGPRDGTDEFCRALEAATAATGDAILVVSAGNENDSGNSLSRVLKADDPSIRTMLIPEMWCRTGSGVLSIWSGDKRPMRVRLVIYDRSTKEYLSSYTVEPETGPFLITDDLNREEYEGFAIDKVFSRAYDNSALAAYYDNETPSGRANCMIAYNLTLSHTENEHAYINLGVIVEGEAGQRIDVTLDGTTTQLHDGWTPGWTAGANELSISSMACAGGVISVGASTVRNVWDNLYGEHFDYCKAMPMGEIAPWSSRGTLVDGRRLPHVAAPGAVIISVNSTPYVESHPDFKDPVVKETGECRNNYWGTGWGTSMSSPAVAGGIALWLEADPSLTADDVYDIIAKTSYRDDSMDPLAWGAGRFDVAAGLREVLERRTALAGPSAVRPCGMAVNVGAGSLSVEIPGADIFNATLYDLTGRPVASAEALGGIAEFDTSALRGVYVLSALGYSRKIML